MPIRERLERMRQIGREQIAAAGRNDLSTLEALEGERARLVGTLSREELQSWLAADPLEGGALLSSLAQGESRVRALLTLRREGRRREIAELERRRRAERAYRAM